MNSNLVTTIVIGGLGFGAGFLAGKKIYESKYAALAQEEIDSVKETFAKSEFRNATKKEINVDDTKIQDMIIEKMNYKPLVRDKKPTPPVDLEETDFSEFDMEDEDDVDEELEESTDGVYGISREAFETHEAFEKMTLTYYLGNKILYSNEADVIVDVDSLIPWQIHEKLVEGEDLYLRDRHLGIDYHIRMDEGSYKMSGSSPRERQKRSSKEGN